MSASSTPTREPVRLQPQRQIGGDRRFADPALARGNGDDRADTGDGAALGSRHRRMSRGAARTRRTGGRARLRRHPAPRRGLRGQHRRHREHAGHRVDRFLRRLTQGFQPRAALGLDLDREGDIAVADRDPRDHAERHDVRPAVGVGDGREGVADLLFGDGHVIPQSGGRNLGGANALPGSRNAPCDDPQHRPGNRSGASSGRFSRHRPAKFALCEESGSAGSA